MSSKLHFGSPVSHFHPNSRHPRTTLDSLIECTLLIGSPSHSKGASLWGIHHGQINDVGASRKRTP